MKRKPLITGAPLIQSPRGNGEPNHGRPPVMRERISKEDHVMLLARKAELEELNRKHKQLQRDLTLVSADLIRKGDEFNERMKELIERYKIVPGRRDLKLETGEIIERVSKE